MFVNVCFHCFLVWFSFTSHGKEKGMPLFWFPPSDWMYKETHRLPEQFFFFFFSSEEEKKKREKVCEGRGCVLRCASLLCAFECRLSLLSEYHTYLHIKGSDVIHPFKLSVSAWQIVSELPAAHCVSLWLHHRCPVRRWGPFFGGLSLEFLLSSTQ